MTTPLNLTPLLRPRAIAIIGATHDATRVGGRPLAYLKRYGYAGAIYPVNPKYDEIDGLRCYPGIDALPETPDLAIVAVPASAVLGVVDACQAALVPALAVYSSGFGEAGEEGAAREAELRQRARQGGTVVCGPNSQGIANLHDRMVAYFTSELGREDVAAGPVGFVSQSGVFGGIMATECIKRGLGLGYLVSTGNEAAVEFGDVVAFLAGEPRVRVIAGYLEGLRDAERLRAAMRIAREHDKPVVVLKAGRSEEAAAAAASHTGAMAGAYDCYRAAFRQWGIVEVDDIEELYDAVETFALCRRRSRGKRVGVLTNSGGIGVLCADKLRELGLEVARFAPETEAAIASHAHAFTSARNPVDIALQPISEPESVRAHLDRIADDSNVDMVLCFLGVIRRHVDVITESIAGAAARTEKPLLAGWLGGEPTGRATLRSLGVPVLSGPDRAAKALRALARHGATMPRQELQPPDLGDVLANLASVPPGATLDEAKAREVLAAAGIPVVRGRLARDAEDAVKAAEAIGYPVVLKIDSADIAHKTEAGGVALDLRSADAVRAAFACVVAKAKAHDPAARIEGVGVYEMVTGGIELIAGIRRDTTFGPTLLLGLGGTLVEILADSALRVLPLARGEAADMIRDLRGYPILDGARGRGRADLDALAAVLERLAALALAAPAIDELDINPLMVLPEGQGVMAADALIVTETAEEGA